MNGLGLVLLPLATVLAVVGLGRRWPRLAAAAGCLGLGSTGVLLGVLAAPVLAAAMRPGVTAAPGVHLDPGGMAYLEIDLGTWFDAGDLVARLLLKVDPLAALLAAVGLLVTVLALGHLALGPRRTDLRGSGGLVLLAVTFTWALLAADALVFFIAWQAMSAAAWLQLSGGAGGRDGHPGRYLLTQQFGSALLLACLVAMAWSLGTFEITEMTSRAATAWRPGEPRALLLALLLLLTAAARAGVVPLHGWIPAIDRTPGAVLAVHLSAGALTAIYLLARFQALFLLGPAALAAAAGLGAIAALSAASAAIAQRRSRAIVGWTFSAQMGAAVLAAGTGHLLAAVIHTLGSVLMVSLLLLAAEPAARIEEEATFAGPRAWGLAAAALGVAAWVGVPLLAPTAASRTAIALTALRPPIGNLSLFSSVCATVFLGSVAASLWLAGVMRRVVAAGPGRRRWLVAPVVLAAIVIVTGAAGFGVAAAGGGLPASLLDGSLRAPPELAAPVANPEGSAVALATMVSPRLATASLLMASALGVLFGWRLADPRGGLRRRLRRSPGLRRVRVAAKNGWYLDDFVYAVGRRPLLILAGLWRPPVSEPLPGETAASSWHRIGVAGLMAAAFQATLVAWTTKLTPEDTLLLLFGSGIAALVVCAVVAAAADGGRRSLFATMLGGVALQLGLTAGSSLPWLAAGLVAVVCATAPARPGALLKSVATPAIGLSVASVAAVLDPSRGAVAAMVAGHVMMLGWFPFQAWRQRRYGTDSLAGALLLAGPWNLAVAWSLLHRIAGVPQNWDGVAGTVALVAALGGLLAAPLALGQRDLRGVVASVHAYLGSAALLGLAAWNTTSLVGVVVLVLLEALVATGLLVRTRVLAASGLGPSIARLRAGPAGSSETRAQTGFLLLLGAMASAGTGASIGWVLALVGAFGAFPGAMSMMVVASLGWTYVATIVVRRIAAAARRPIVADATPAVGAYRLLAATLAILVMTTGMVPGPMVSRVREGVVALLRREVPFEPTDPEPGNGRMRVAAVIADHVLEPPDSLPE